MTGSVTYADGSTPRICIVGAGFSGLCAAIQLKKQLGCTSFTIYEALKDVGGTWLANTYPGCACDVPSHLYSYSFELNPDWTMNYSTQPEIWAYVRNVAKNHDLYKHIKFETEIKTMTWKETTRKWEVVIVDNNSNQEQIQHFDLVINGPGALRVPFIPEQFKGFKGPLIHSAEWKDGISLEDKVVGVVGCGASAVQIIPKIVNKVKELHAYQRKPAYVVPKFQKTFPNWLKTVFAYVPLVMRLYRLFLFLFNELLSFQVFKHKSWMSGLGRKLALHHLRKQIPNNAELVKKLTPNFEFGCKRLLPSEDYYPALAKSNVTVHTDSVQQVTSSGIETQDGLQKLDVLILATGFRVHDYYAPMQIYGRNGEDILTTWKTKTPRTYYGIVGRSAPNHFIVLGPNTGLGHNTIIFTIECQVNFIIQVIAEMMKRDAGLVLIKQSAEDECMDWIEEKLKGTVWGASKCGSWYANEAGIITTLWPESSTSYWRKTRKVNFSHFEFN